MKLSLNKLEKQIFNINEWREYIACKKSGLPNTWFPDFQISNDELSIYDVPDPNASYMDQDSLIQRIRYFALTYNAYEDKELFNKYHKIYDEYFKEKKHKNSLQHLRALLFFLQRHEHFGGPNDNYANEFIKIVNDLRNLILKNQ